MDIYKTLVKKVEDFLKSLYRFYKIPSEVTNVNSYTYIGNSQGCIRFQDTLVRESDKYAESISDIQKSKIVDFFLSPISYTKEVSKSQPKVNLGFDKKTKWFFIHTKKFDCMISEHSDVFFGDFGLPNTEKEYMVSVDCFCGVLKFFEDGEYNISHWQTFYGDFLFVENSVFEGIVRNMIDYNQAFLEKANQKFSELLMRSYN